MDVDNQDVGDGYPPDHPMGDCWFKWADRRADGGLYLYCEEHGVRLAAGKGLLPPGKQNNPDERDKYIHRHRVLFRVTCERAWRTPPDSDPWSI
jgi:hypothetical protein